jgi:ATP-dependent protease ClpP protease subunit
MSRLLPAVSLLVTMLAMPVFAQTAPRSPNSKQLESAPSTAAGDAKAKPRQVFIVPMEGMVGAGLRHDEMVKVEQEADKYGNGQIIVLKINSGGGSVTEGDRIVRTLERVREKHRLVAWLEEAISGAAFTAMNCPEIYFMKVGTMGSITKFSGDGSGGQVSASGRDLEAWIERVAEVAEGGGHNGQVGRAMVYSPIVVSYTKDPRTGKVTFYADATGEVMLSDEGDNLTLNADNALDCGYSNGTADTEEELFKAMQLVPGTYEVNAKGREIGDNWLKTLERAKKQRRDITQDLGLLGNDPAAIAKRIKLYRQMQDLWRRALPVAEGMEGGGPFIPPEAEDLAGDLFEKYGTAPDRSKIAIEAIDRCIKEWQKRLAEARKR